MLTPALVEAMIADESSIIRHELGAEQWATGRYGEAGQLFRELALSDEFAEFLTLTAYDLL